MVWVGRLFRLWTGMSSRRTQYNPGFLQKYACFLARYLWFFPNTLLWIFWLFLLRLGYCTMFFLRCSPIFCTQQHRVVRLTQFPLLVAHNSHNSTKVVSWWSVTSALTNTSAFVRWFNCLFPLCLRCKLPLFCCCSCLFLDENFTLLQTGWLFFSLASFMPNLLSLFFLGEPANMLSLAVSTKWYFIVFYWTA